MDDFSLKTMAAAASHRAGATFPLLVCAAALALATWSPPAPAQGSDVYVCVGPSGVPEYRNNNGGKGCRRLDLPAEAVTVPGTRVNKGSGGGGGNVAVSPNSFPRVDSATQKSRDSERRSVLEQELAIEEQKLTALRAEYNNGEPERQGGERNYQKYLDRTSALKDNITRSEANVAALRRELGNLK